MNFENLKLKIGILVFLVSFAVYVYTLNPSVSAADSNEIVTTAVVLGIPHQPSYPLNTVIGHLFTKIPFGTLPWRVNLMSAVVQALTAMVMYFVILKMEGLVVRGQRTGNNELTPNPYREAASFAYSLAPFVLAATAALFLSFSLEFWQFANRAEVFPLNNLFGAILIWIVVSWGEKVSDVKYKQSLSLRDQISNIKSDGEDTPQEPVLPKPPKRYSMFTKYLPDEVTGRFSSYRPKVLKKIKKPKGFSLRLLYLLAFVAGLAFTHHQTIVLLAPAFLYLLLSRGIKLWWKKVTLVKLALILLLGIVPYFVILITIAKADPPVRWGEPVNVAAAFRALTRADYGTFSPYAQSPSEYEGSAKKETAKTQVVFYLNSLNKDFTLLGIIFAILGGYFLFRQKRTVFIFLFLGLMFSGPIFLGFANWTLDSGFHQAVAKRFQMIPNLFFTLFLAFGFFFLWRKFSLLNLDFKKRENQLTGFILLSGLSLTFLFPFVRNFKNADNHDNFLTITYARDSLIDVPKNAIVLISGDITTFAFEYWENLVDKDSKRIVFSPGLMYMKWYVERLKKEHPEIVIPPTLPGHIEPSTTQIVEANFGKRPIYVSPELARYDPALTEKYVLWPRKLLFFVQAKGQDLKLEPYREENEQLWESLDFKLLEKTRLNNPLLEYAMVPEYARHFFNTGSVFESVQLYDDAIREYQRALVVHPAFPDPYKNLGRIYGFKLKNKDYQKAFDNFNIFLARAIPGQEADVEAVKEAMGMLQEEAVRESTMAGQLKEASEFGETKEASESGKKE
ncbi:MAG: DUF2723 domain-containing protein [bacterium]|nr:DUF2723 domain-containing protein [bacterium]